jgi:hypothetical protein
VGKTLTQASSLMVSQKKLGKNLLEKRASSVTKTTHN